MKHEKVKWKEDICEKYLRKGQPKKIKHFTTVSAKSLNKLGRKSAMLGGMKQEEEIDRNHTFQPPRSMHEDGVEVASIILERTKKNLATLCLKEVLENCRSHSV